MTVQSCGTNANIKFNSKEHMKQYYVRKSLTGEYEIQISNQILHQAIVM